MNGKMNWFRCYPDRLIGALGEMDGDTQHVYVTILLKMYARGGPLRIDARAIAAFTRRHVRVVQNAVSRLIEMGRLIETPNGLSNPLFEEELLHQREVSEIRRKSGAKGVREKGNTLPEEKGEENQGAEGAFATQKPTEERREEKKDIKETPPNGGAKKVGRRLPLDWRLTSELVAYAESKGLDRQTIATEAEKFKNFWTAKSGRDATKLDWDATWRNWVMNVRKPPQAAPPKPSRNDVYDEARRRLREMKHANGNHYDLDLRPEQPAHRIERQNPPRYCVLPDTPGAAGRGQVHYFKGALPVAKR